MIVYGRRDASVALHFDGLRSTREVDLSFVEPRNPGEDLAELSRAALVILVRGFSTAEGSGLLTALRRLGIPVAWFTDDDLAALHDEGVPTLENYSRERVAGFVRHCAVLLAATEGLADRLKLLHPVVRRFGCIFDATIKPPAESPRSRLRVAAIGGTFRAEGMRRLVVPAISAMPGPELVVNAELAEAAGIEAIRVPFEPSFVGFLSRWQAFAPDVLVHPPGRTANLYAKGPGTLLVAAYLGAVPIVSPEPAYKGMGPQQGVLVAADLVGWRTAFAELADPSRRRDLRARLLAYCRERFGPERAARQLADLVAAAPRTEGVSLAAAQRSLRWPWRPGVVPAGLRFAYRAYKTIA